MTSPRPPSGASIPPSPAPFPYPTGSPPSSNATIRFPTELPALSPSYTATHSRSIPPPPPPTINQPAPSRDTGSMARLRRYCLRISHRAAETLLSQELRFSPPPIPRSEEVSPPQSDGRGQSKTQYLGRS